MFCGQGNLFLSSHPTFDSMLSIVCVCVCVCVCECVLVILASRGNCEPSSPTSFPLWLELWRSRSWSYKAQPRLTPVCYSPLNTLLAPHGTHTHIYTDTLKYKYAAALPCCPCEKESRSELEWKWRNDTATGAGRLLSPWLHISINGWLMSRAGLIWPAHHRPDPSGQGALASQPVQLEPSPL